ncbi:Winged helix-turn-helix transcription repressor DNA-binding [Penicillium verhagenii]|uniref:Winged helix-turn-helix transcription repressor DNA-binding n=1 Tax=Penicillium verhagenii TaxID=1562060 RepID=UPI0025455B1F|nr:Winged helix-turn-helix transcription repressor DNA-binding [Penicillium verhagenii]KAJ5921408.1 Winged helix-turn-helix transcription repressor DNA-binding [Penicillium verhagenii]
MWMHQEEPPQSFVYHPMDMESAMKMEDSEGTLLSIPTASPSPISTTSTHHSTSHRSISHHSSSQSPTSVLSNSNSNLINTMVENLSPTNSSGDSEEDHPTDPPYSQLIYQALKETTGYRLQLQDIYAWFEKNTNKGKDQGKGWQNSIRHNLSMNAGFEAIRSDSPGGKRTVNYWSLTAQAISKGRVESTTRYRRPNPKRSANSDLPTPRRNGHGVCQRGSVKLQKTWEENQSRQQAKHHHHRHHDKRDEKAKHHDKHRPTTTTTTTTTTNTAVSEASHQQPQHQHSPSSLDDGLISQHSQQQGGGQQSPYHQLSPGAPVPQIYPRAFDYDAVVGCTAASHENSPMFSDSTPGWEPMRMGDYEWCYAPNNGAGDGSGDQSSLYGHGHVKEERWG